MMTLGMLQAQGDKPGTTATKSAQPSIQFSETTRRNQRQPSHMMTLGMLEAQGDKPVTTTQTTTQTTQTPLNDKKKQY